jgi:uncharacterized protein
MDNLIIERDVSIPTDDGTILKADVFRPRSGQPAPVIMTLGPYGKGVPIGVGYTAQLNWLVKKHPNVLPGSTREFLTWETVDPELWVPWGYVCIRVDSRGAGRSPGYLDMFSPREVKDLYDSIEWAGVQPWSNGKVGLNGISYYAMNQWLVASLQPPHLAAMVPWEGCSDFYREWGRHGGIMSNGFLEGWFPKQVLSLQHGNPNGVVDPWLKESSVGPSLLDEEQLKKNRLDSISEVLNRHLDDKFYKDRSPDWSKVTVPFLSCANWAGTGLHERGNCEGFTRAASKQKWLEIHPGRHDEWFYLQEGMDIQKRFMDHFLMGKDNGWQDEPPVLLRLRRPFEHNHFELRKELAWPLPSTEWSRIYFSASDHRLSWDQPATEASASYSSLEEPLIFTSAPLDQDTEFTGPLAAKIFASSSTTDIDLFVTLQAFSPEGKEVEYQGTIDPHSPLAQGWLRASHRKLDPVLSRPYRPYHTHDELQPLESGRVYELDIELWPTNIILPAGFRLIFRVEGKDFARPDIPEDAKEFPPFVSTGSGPFLHTHPEDRPEAIFGGKTTIYTGGNTASYILLPVIKPQ